MFRRVIVWNCSLNYAFTCKTSSISNWECWFSFCRRSWTFRVNTLITTAGMGYLSPKLTLRKIAPLRQMHWNLIWKSPGYVPFGANLTHFGAKPTIPVPKVELAFHDVSNEDSLRQIRKNNIMISSKSYVSSYWATTCISYDLLAVEKTLMRSVGDSPGGGARTSRGLVVSAT